MDSFNVVEIVAAITTHARFIDRPAARYRGIGTFATSKRGARAGVEIHGVSTFPDGRVRFDFAAFDGVAEHDSDVDSAWPFTVTFGPSPHGDEYTEIAVDTGTGPGSARYTVPDNDAARTVANTIIRGVCDAHEIGRKRR